MIKELNVDIAIIGTGTTGMVAYKEAKKYTDSIILIEADQYGTTCARVGCMPSKLLIAAAEAADSVDKANIFGIETSSKKINGQRVMQRVRDERDRFVSFILKAIGEIAPKHLIKSKAKFIDNNRLSLENGQIIEAKSIIIAVGSSPSIPDNFKSVGERLITSNEVFYWQDLPKSIAVIGTGIIGFELGQAFSKLGIKTTIFGRNKKIAQLKDPVIADLAVEVFSEELDLELNSEIKEIKNNNDSVKVFYKNGKGEEAEKTFEFVLLATGRNSNINSLNLSATKLVLDDKQIPVFNRETTQCSEAHIFIAGDANSKLPLLHEASDEGRIAGNNAGHFIQSQNIESFQRRSRLSIVFSDPQIMQVGMSHKDLTEKNIAFEIGEASFKDQGRARAFAINKGAIRVYGDKQSKQLLGAEMLGPSAEHIGHLLAWSHQSKLSIDELLARPFYHPTLEEGLRTALQDLNQKLK